MIKMKTIMLQYREKYDVTPPHQKYLTETYVMPEPSMNIIDGKAVFSGKVVHIDAREDCMVLKYLDGGQRVTDFLKVAGVLNYQNAVGSCVEVREPHVSRELQRSVHDALSIIDEGRLKRDLEKRGYALCMFKENYARNETTKLFECDKNKGYVSEMDRILQDIIIQRWNKELKLSSNLRLLKAQESIDLMISDKAYRKDVNGRTLCNLEVIHQVILKPVSGYRIKDDKMEFVSEDTDILTSDGIASVWSGWWGNTPHLMTDGLLHYQGIAGVKLDSIKKK